MLSLVIMQHPQKISCVILDAIFMLLCANLATISFYYGENFSHYCNCSYYRLSLCLKYTSKRRPNFRLHNTPCTAQWLTVISVAILKKYIFLTCLANIYVTSHILRKEHPAVSRKYALVAALYLQKPQETLCMRIHG